MLSPLVLRQNAAIMQLEEITLVDFTFEINVWIVIEKGDTMAVLGNRGFTLSCLFK